MKSFWIFTLVELELLSVIALVEIFRLVDSYYIQNSTLSWARRWLIGVVHRGRREDVLICLCILNLHLLKRSKRWTHHLQDRSRHRLQDSSLSFWFSSAHRASLGWLASFALTCWSETVSSIVAAADGADAAEGADEIWFAWPALAGWESSWNLGSILEFVVPPRARVST